MGIAAGVNMADSQAAPAEAWQGQPDAALVRADQPSLEERGDVVDARHDLVTRIATAADDGDLVLVAGAANPE